jgi:hypothetical protein
MADDRKTSVFDWKVMDFATGIDGAVRTVTGIQAAVQVVQKAEQTQLGKYSVYGDMEDPAQNHIYGSRVHDVSVRTDLPEAVKKSEMEREAKEAIIYDPWVNDVPYVSVYSQKDADGETRDYMDIQVDTVFGAITLEGVGVNGG